MAVAGRQRFARLVEPILGERANGLEQTEAAVGSAHDERLTDQAADQIEPVRIVADDRLGVRRTKPTAEHCQSPKHGLLVSGQQVVAPPNGRIEGPLARDGVATCRGHAREAPIELSSEVFQRQRGTARCRQLEREWNTVQADTDAMDERGIRFIRHEAEAGPTEAVDEEDSGFARSDGVRR